MTKKLQKRKFETINEVNVPKFGESLVDIFYITGKNADFSKYPLNQGKTRYFKDGKGIFKEMDKERHKKGIKTIAE